MPFTIVKKEDPEERRRRLARERQARFRARQSQESLDRIRTIEADRQRRKREAESQEQRAARRAMDVSPHCLAMEQITPEKLKEHGIAPENFLIMPITLLKKEDPEERRKRLARERQARFRARQSQGTLDKTKNQMTAEEFEELKRLRKEVAKKQFLLEQQQEECMHLVRICEQRRQENLSLEAKLAGLDQRSRDMLVQQDAVVSASSVALSRLGTRLDALMEQLASSCNITDADLEEIIFDNEACTQSVSSSLTSAIPRPPECSKRGESFLQVILGAIQTATHSPFSEKCIKEEEETDQNTEPFEFLDLKTEPDLNLENVHEENSSCHSNAADYDENCSSRIDLMKQPKYHSNSIPKYGNDMGQSDHLQNHSEAVLNRPVAVKIERSESLDESPVELTSIENCSSPIDSTKEQKDDSGYQNDVDRSHSLHNLSEAVLNHSARVKTERSDSLDEIAPVEVNTLVDQVNDIGKSVTKFLKAVRIVLVENEQYMEELHEERTTLTDQLHKEKANRLRLENNLQRLQQELAVARSQTSESANRKK